MSAQATASPTGIRAPSAQLSRLFAQPEVTAGIVVAVLLLVLLFGSPFFLNANNLASLQTSIGPMVLLAIGMTILFVTGTFDLSIGATMALAGLVATWLLSAGLSWQMAMLGGVGVGAVVGVFNGMLVSYVGLNPLIVTLGALYVLRGLVDLMIGGGRPQPWMYVSGPEVDPGFYAFGSLHVGAIHIILFLAIVLALGADVILRRHPVGRRFYLAGDNPDAARSLGIPVRRLQLAGFVLCGVLAAIAGMFIAARTGLASRHIGSGVELQIIIACLVGGASIAGGRGSVLGSVLGVLFITLVNNAFNLFEVAAEWQKVVVGSVLISVIVSDGWRSLRRARRGK